MNINGFSAAELAYFGDSVIELLVRERLIKSSLGNIGTLNKEALKYVKATAQSAALEKILPLLTEEEESAFRRGRNNHTGSIPKSASACEYRRATGFEALFGFLWLSERYERARELFNTAYSDDCFSAN